MHDFLTFENLSLIRSLSESYFPPVIAKDRQRNSYTRIFLIKLNVHDEQLLEFTDYMAINYIYIYIIF